MKAITERLFRRPADLICLGAALAVYGINRFMLKDAAPDWARPFCRYYLNDLVCPLFFIPYCEIVLRVFIGKELCKLWQIMLLTLSAALLWEFAAPVINKKSVTDLLDIVCYLAGSGIYCAVCRKALRHDSGQ